MRAASNRPDTCLHPTGGHQQQRFPLAEEGPSTHARFDERFARFRGRCRHGENPSTLMALYPDGVGDLYRNPHSDWMLHASTPTGHAARPEKNEDLCPLQLAAEHDFAVAIGPARQEYAPGNVQTGHGDLHGGRLFPARCTRQLRAGARSRTGAFNRISFEQR